MRTKLSFLLIVLFAGSVGLAELCTPRSNGPEIFSHESQPDDFVPYPWGFELPFPWVKAQGLWKANVGTAQAYYTFEVVRESEATEKQLLIKQYDAKTCEVVAVGVGVENDRKTIWALMKLVSKPVSYRIGLRNFSAEKLPKYLPNDEGRVMVMSVSMAGTLKVHYYPLQKLPTASSSQSENCDWVR